VYRYQWNAEIQFGRKQELLEIFERIRGLEVSRGWSPAMVWTPMFGQMHTVTLEADYADLQALEQEEEKRAADAEFAELMGRTLPLLVQGSSHVKLLVSHE
jgi:NIPSNAP